MAAGCALCNAHQVIQTYYNKITIGVFHPHQTSNIMTLSSSLKKHRSMWCLPPILKCPVLNIQLEIMPDVTLHPFGVQKVYPCGGYLFSIGSFIPLWQVFGACCCCCVCMSLNVFPWQEVSQCLGTSCISDCLFVHS